jgi:hypothetical protein
MLKKKPVIVKESKPRKLQKSSRDKPLARNKNNQIDLIKDGSDPS